MGHILVPSWLIEYSLMKTILFLIIFVCFSCNDRNYIRKYNLPKTSSSIAKKEVKNNNIKTSFTWAAPLHWEENAPSSMRLASYLLPYTDGMGDLSVTHFQGDGGGLLANVNRWRRQLELEPEELVQIKNQLTFKQSSIGEVKFIQIINQNIQDSAFLCSIITTRASTIFLKLNVSILGIKELEKEFQKFALSFRYLEE